MIPGPKLGFFNVSETKLPSLLLLGFNYLGRSFYLYLGDFTVVEKSHKFELDELSFIPQDRFKVAMSLFTVLAAAAVCSGL